jgi:hypothetical protein
MEKRYNILTIGDIHGRSAWKELIFGGETEFFFWKQAVENNYLEYEDKFSFHEYDKIIFVGDYVDSFDISSADILENLKEIVLFAKTYPDLVVLLLGNHDIQYIVPNEICSGYRGEMYHDLHQLFKENEDLFRIAFLDEFEHEYKGRLIMNRTLWTHAGVTHGWFTEFTRDIANPRYRHQEFFEGSENWKIDEIINTAWKLRVDNLYNVDATSGGHSVWAGPLWVRPHILNDFYLEGYDHVVGHTPQSAVYQFCPLLGVESNPEKLNTLTYVDALMHKDVYKLKRLKDDDEN